MPTFPSRAWLAEAIRLFNQDPETAAAGSGWVGEVGFRVLSEPGQLSHSYAAYLVPAAKGGVERFEYLENADELEGLEPPYVLSAGYSVWKALLKGEMDPVEAVFLRRVEIQGNLQQILERVRFRGIIERVLSQLDSEFVDEQG